MKPSKKRPWQNDMTDALALIPEPSTMTLVGAGLLGVLGMIRRRRSEEEASGTHLHQRDEVTAAVT